MCKVTDGKRNNSMELLFQHFKKFNPVSKEAENAIAEICTVVTIKKIKNCSPLVIPVKPFTSSTMAWPEFIILMRGLIS